MSVRGYHLFIVAAGLGLIAPWAEGQLTPPGSPAVEVARARQESIKTVDIEFKVKEVVAAGGISTEMPQFSKGKTLPEKETTIESVNRLVLDRNKIRYENNHPIWAPEQGKLHYGQLINVCDGETNKNLDTIGINDPNTPEGVITRNPLSYDIKSTLLIPMTFTLRGLEPSISPYVASDLKPTGSTLPVSKAPCQEYVKSGRSEQVIKFWLDPAAGYLPRRIRREMQGKPSEQFDIKYRWDDKCGWVPESWVLNRFFTTGAVRITATIEVTKMVCNQPCPDEVFELRFPPGAKVYDSRNDKAYRVQSDGTMREYSFATGEDLSEVVSQLGDSWFRRHGTTAIVIGVCVVIFGLLAAWAAKKKRAVQH